MEDGQHYERSKSTNRHAQLGRGPCDGPVVTPVTINLALQGGGAHGAFTWGVLDRLLDENWITIEGITATSAGAVNAAAFKAGYVENGREGARARLNGFWEAMGGLSTLTPDPVKAWLDAIAPPLPVIASLTENNPAIKMAELFSQALSPYETNPLNYHPLRSTIDAFFDFESICAAQGPKLFISATNVRSGKIKIFQGDEINTDVILASACLPQVFQAVEIYDSKTRQTEAYWDGGFMGNPALFPLFYETKTSDILLVHINPMRREALPKTAKEIENRVNEISFNSSLLRELRSIEFVQRLIREGRVKQGDMKDIHIHSIADDATMVQLGVATKHSPTASLMSQLKKSGQEAMDGFLRDHAGNLGKIGTCDLREMFS